MVKTSLLRTLQVIFRHKWLIFTFFVVTVGVINLLSYTLPPVYQATAQFLVVPGSEQLPIYTSSATVTDRVPSESLHIETVVSEMQLLQTRPVMERVCDKLGLSDRSAIENGDAAPPKRSAFVTEVSDAIKSTIAGIHDLLVELELVTVVEPREAAINTLQKSLTVTPVFSSNVFTVTYMDDSPKIAATVVNAVAEAYLDYRQDVYKPPGVVDHFKDELDQRKQELEQARERLRAFQDKYQVVNLESEIDNALRLYEDAKKSGAFNQQRDQYAARLAVLREIAPEIRDLRFDVDNAQQLYERYAQKFDEVSSNAELDRSKFANVRLIEPASENTKPVFPNRLANFVLSVVLGVLGGVGLALVVNYFSDKVNVIEDVEAAAVRALGSVPLLKRRRERRRAFVAQRCRQACSLITEQLRLPEIAHGIVVRGTSPGVGCSTMAVGLAVALAESPEQRVLLVDANLQDPSLHTALDIDDVPVARTDQEGLNDIQRAVRSTEYGNLDLLTATRFEALQRSDPTVMRRLLGELAGHYDFVLVDTPPIFSSASPLKGVEGWSAILVVAARRTSIQVVRRAVDMLARQGLALAGAVLNKREDSLPGFIYRRL